METFLNGRVVLHCGDSRDVLKTIADCSIDSIVTDPPYALVSIVKRFGKTSQADDTDTSDRTRRGADGYARLAKGFMGKEWDNGETAFATDFWAECLRVLKPGGHVVAFGGTRTYHRMACAIEDAGFEVRDMLSWLYGSGFPKSHDVAKGLDKKGGHYLGKAGVPIPFQSVAKGQEYVRTAKGAPVLDEAKQWEGWGTALKPACEPICFGRKPLIGTVAANVLEHGTGAINIDGCRVGTDENLNGGTYAGSSRVDGVSGSMAGPLQNAIGKEFVQPTGRWPANIIHDGSDEVIAAFPDVGGQQGAVTGNEPTGNGFSGDVYGYGGTAKRKPAEPRGDSGSAARFFYTAKADGDDRLGSKHPTVKPVDLMQWLCRLVTPKGGTILDPFSGTGTTGEAAFREGFNAVLIEREEEYQADIRRRMALCMSGPDERKRESIKAKVGDLPFGSGSLFESLNKPIDPDTPPADSGGRFTGCSRTNYRTNRNETLEPSEQP